jgi:hypothetical protein
MKEIEDTHPSLNKYLDLIRILCTNRLNLKCSAEEFVNITEIIDKEVQKHRVRGEYINLIACPEILFENLTFS